MLLNPIQPTIKTEKNFNFVNPENTWFMHYFTYSFMYPFMHYSLLCNFVIIVGIGIGV